MQLRNHVDTQLVKRFKRWKVFAIYLRIENEIWNVTSVQEWNFTAQMVWWLSRRHGGFWLA